MSIVRFEATKLADKGKKGIIKPDADGYYLTPVGGLNAINSSGHLYSADARYLFEGADAKSILQRRIKSGNLKGEAGHPKPLPGQSMEDFKYRLLSIEETRVSHHIRRIILDDGFGKANPEYGNPDLIGILAEIRPAGPMGPALKDAFENPHENVNFSIRGFTDDTFVRGKRVRTLFEVVTFDWVTEPGIASSNKWSSPSIESAALESFLDVPFSQRDLEAIVKASAGTALESDSVQLARSALTYFDARPMAGITTKPLNISRW